MTQDAPVSSRTLLAVTGLALAVCLAWDVLGLDLAAARWAGDAHGFALRDEWFLSQALHAGARRTAWLAALLLCLSVGLPFGPLRAVPRARRLQWAAGALASVGLIALLKAGSATSCPWDLRDFGGLALHVSHWSPLADGGPGHCFPAGHASTGFAFVGGWFALRPTHPRGARRVLAASLAAGAALGLSQQWRGAHFMSHTLWTGWLCWAGAFAIDRAFRWERAA